MIINCKFCGEELKHSNICFHGEWFCSIDCALNNERRKEFFKKFNEYDENGNYLNREKMLNKNNRENEMKCKCCGELLGENHIKVPLQDINGFRNGGGLYFCDKKCLNEYRKSIQGENEMKDYDREYSIQEVFEFEEGTEFLFNKAIYTIEENELGIVGLGKCYLNKDFIKGKFKLKRKERKVDFMEAFTEFRKGLKSIYVILEGNKNVFEEEKTETNYSFTEDEIDNGDWYILY